jgi:predicted metal-binding membrane protein
MEAARVQPIRPARGQLGLIALLLALAAAAWLVTDERMSGMDDGPGTDPGSLGFYVTAWVVMMAAMMFPSIAPMVRTYALVQRRRIALGRTHGGATIGAFIAGYVAAWTAFGLAAYAVFALAESLPLDALAWDRAGRYLAAGVIAAAAVYQLTPAKDACLRRCRGPLDFLLERWRDGAAGAARMGVEHGAWCVGCCWGLMAALFALGVMSVGWMVFVAGLIAIEKLLPWQPLPSRTIALMLLLLAVGVAASPEHVPGLTIPGDTMAGM